ncbi:hypothetical protein, partial [Mycolicibacter minnesotensis]|uniref:hypothetical protein n=1 Tax=Mycolicibacter minnesotensis TaxID=1118379 RepID=UPI0021F3C6A4
MSGAIEMVHHRQQVSRCRRLVSMSHERDIGESLQAAGVDVGVGRDGQPVLEGVLAGDVEDAQLGVDARQQ